MTDTTAYLAELEHVADALRGEPEVSCLSPIRALQGRAYRYITKADRLPVSADRASDPLCPVRLFNPTGIGTWWLASYDPATGLAFGVALIHEREAGDIWLPELVAYRGRVRLAGEGAESRRAGPGLPIERDLYYTPVTVRAILAGGGN